MKILHVIPSLSPSLGGPPLVAVNLVKNLNEIGIKAEILTTDYAGTGLERMQVPLNQRVNYSFSDQLTIPTWFLPFNPPALKEFIFSSGLTRWLWLNIQNYDVLDNHYLFSYAPTCAAAIARRKNVPYTVRTMGQLTSWALEQSAFKKKVYTHLIERKNLRQATAIHCTTPAEAEDVRNFGIQTPTVTLPLGVEVPASYPDAKIQLHQQYNIPEHIPIILFLSRLHYKKCPDLLIKSLSEIKNKGIDFYTILAGLGEPEYVEYLKQLARSLCVDQQIVFPGLVLGKDKDILLQGADLFVLPSFSENFGIAVAEAIISGLPVVITPGIQIAQEIADMRAGLIVEGNVESISEAVVQLLTQPRLRAELSLNGQSFAQARYSWPSIAKNLASVYQTILKDKKLSQDIKF